MTATWGHTQHELNPKLSHVLLHTNITQCWVLFGIEKACLSDSLSNYTPNDRLSRRDCSGQLLIKEGELMSLVLLYKSKLYTNNCSLLNWFDLHFITIKDLCTFAFLVALTWISVHPIWLLFLSSECFMFQRRCNQCWTPFNEWP